VNELAAGLPPQLLIQSGGAINSTPTNQIINISPQDLESPLSFQLPSLSRYESRRSS
jgi:hypothetical protein